jgi:flagellar motor component MotA
MSTNNELSDTQRMLLHAIMFSSLLSTLCGGIFSYDLCGPCQSELFCWRRLKIVILICIDVCTIVVVAYCIYCKYLII